MKDSKRITNQHGNDTERAQEKTKLIYPKLSYNIRGAVFDVYKELGPYHKEKIYENALKKEFEERNIKYQRQKRIKIEYKNEKVGTYVPDLIAEDKILIELKAVKKLHSSAIKQLYYYLNNSRFRLGFLINFNQPKKVRIIRRVV